MEWGVARKPQAGRAGARRERSAHRSALCGPGQPHSPVCRDCAAGILGCRPVPSHGASMLTSPAGQRWGDRHRQRLLGTRGHTRASGCEGSTFSMWKMRTSPQGPPGPVTQGTRGFSTVSARVSARTSAKSSAADLSLAVWGRWFPRGGLWGGREWPKAVHRSSAFPTKIPMAAFTKTETTVLKCVWNHRRSRIAEAISRNKNKAGGITLPDFKLSQSYGHQSKQTKKPQSSEQCGTGTGTDT